MEQLVKYLLRMWWHLIDTVIVWFSLGNFWYVWTYLKNQQLFSDFFPRIILILFFLGKNRCYWLVDWIRYNGRNTNWWTCDGCMADIECLAFRNCLKPHGEVVQFWLGLGWWLQPIGGSFGWLMDSFLVSLFSQNVVHK